MSGASYDPTTGRLYYSRSGYSFAFYRLFEPESGLLSYRPLDYQQGAFPQDPVFGNIAPDASVRVGNRMITPGVATSSLGSTPAR